MDNFMILLFNTSVLTCLLTEATKKTLSGASIEYSGNILAVFMSAVASCLVSIYHIIQNSITVDINVVFEVIILFVMSWVCSMVGYDKVKQSISQLTDK